MFVFVCVCVLLNLFIFSGQCGEISIHVRTVVCLIVLGGDGSYCSN